MNTDNVRERMDWIDSVQKAQAIAIQALLADAPTIRQAVARRAALLKKYPKAPSRHAEQFFR